MRFFWYICSSFFRLSLTPSIFGKFEGNISVLKFLIFRACQGNLSHFSNKIKFSHFCLRLVGRNFSSLPTCELPLPLTHSCVLLLLAVLAVDDLLFVSEQLAIKQLNRMALPAKVVYVDLANLNGELLITLG